MWRTALSLKISLWPVRTSARCWRRGRLHLRAERKSPATIKSYGDGVRRFVAWCEEKGHSPALDRRTVAAFVADILESGAEPATARSRHLALRRFSAWLIEERELRDDPLLGTKSPKLDAKVVPVLTEDQLRALVKACDGPDLRDRRDEAVVRLMAETGMRAGEVIGMTSADVDLPRSLAVVRRGKGGKGWTVPFGPQTGRALDRYMRLRPAHGWSRRNMIDRYTKVTAEHRAAGVARGLRLGEL